MKKQASARWCFVCGVENPRSLGLRFYEPGPGETVAEITIPEEYQGYPGIVHGGVVAAMLDEVAGRAFLGEGEPRFMVTARLMVRYRRPVPVGRRLVLKGHAKEDRGRVAVAASEIYAEDGILLAEAEVVLSDIPAGVSENFADEEIGWQVYPDEE